MADDALKRGEAIGRQVGYPRASLVRKADTAPLNTDANIPLLLVQEGCRFSKLILIVASWESGSPSQASLSISQLRNGVSIASVSVAMNGGWAVKVPVVIATPGWLLERDDILMLSVLKSGAGYALSNLMVVAETEL